MIRYLVAGAVLAVMGAAFYSQGHQEPAQLVASYVTPLDGRSSAQRHNAELCAKKLDGTLIPAGGEFSFNKTVGPWSRDQGFRRAPVSYGGQLIDAWGGGVCQTSTTLYNAALLAGFQVLSRHPHTYAPGYVSPGRDAAVAYPNIDLKFVNRLPVAVVVHVRVVGDQLRAELWAKTRQRAKVEVWQRPIALIEPRTIRLSPEPQTWVRNPGKTGYVVETWRSVDGVVERLSTDSYPVMDRVLDGASHR